MTYTGLFLQAVGNKLVDFQNFNVHLCHRFIVIIKNCLELAYNNWLTIHHEKVFWWLQIWTGINLQKREITYFRIIFTANLHVNFEGIQQKTTNFNLVKTAVENVFTDAVMEICPCVEIFSSRSLFRLTTVPRCRSPLADFLLQWNSEDSSQLAC